MKKHYTIKETAIKMGKSITTIKRLIKAEKLKTIESTHGFNIRHLITQKSIDDYYMSLKYMF